MNLYQPTITGSLSVSGSVNISGSITIAGGGTISGTASIATNAITASSADNFLVRNTLTAQTLVVQTITSSVDFVTGSTRFGSISANTHVFTGSMFVTGALYVPTGSVGIGTTSPLTTLSVVGSGPNGILLDQDIASAGASSRLFFKMNTQTYAMLADSNGLNFLSGATAGSSTGSPRMTISSSGSVGIGTINPQELLHITGSSPAIRIGGARTYLLQTVDTDGRFRIHDNTGGERFTIASGSGYVGIGTTTPSSQLHIAAPGATNAELRIVGYGYGSTYNTTLRSTVGSIGVLQFGNNGDNYILAGNTGAGGYLVFRVNCSTESITSGTEAMRIASSGAVYKYVSATDTNSEMYYNIVASGGNTTTTTTTNGATYKIHTFTSTGTFTVYGYGLVEVLVVGGGGGGGWDVGGGGGAGGYVETSTFVVPGTYTITIGSGGSGSGTSGGTANSGVQSTALGFVALGGGGGGNYSGGTGGNGANGGGGSGYSGGFFAGGSGTFRQGNDGGAGRSDLYSSGATGGGGGGAAAVGAQSTNNIASYALGGAGVVSYISGSSVTYCKGGAGGGDSWGGATDGAANTGNGGDGAGNPNTGKNGGSGIVIIRYKV